MLCAPSRLSQVVDTDYPNLHLYASQVSDGYVHDSPGNLLEGSFRDRTLVLTFNKFMQRTSFVSLMRTMLQTLEQIYGQALDTEFTLRLESDGRLRLNLLQCRPMSLPGWSPGETPNHIPPERVLFRANRMAGGGIVRGIGYIVYVDPAAYAELIADAQGGGSLGSEAGLSGRLGRLIGEINHHPQLRSSKVMMMGPGRWGSSNPALGVHVTYADIDNTAVLVEIAREERGYLPEVSFGTHFFQDLVEDQIIYLPLYPDDPAASYHAEFFADAPNILAKLLPEAADDAFAVKVIDVVAASGGLQAHVVADPAAHKAVCYLGE